ncbi:ABC-type nitrate/sulfonate/bicarbonate transport system, permease component RimI [Peptoclostridium acidaminophilum DSM 3953]|uniref:[Ribosomal protein bS18]-alanine N-acetyltransferase n=1 Tax=Peptoclostridium acidaminophilum DSM 3953 TaxID=1286171 RepID=W8T856_PEPAC|nr:ribosomal protein S18-alanine N-acetyltransferase [Peptoclostridium acidaminophilum]AHM57060.1 ABC-type nitrate/sulfonate/bicarbonate transport system, permease component RimI [Peptoclostridium acidaminophilum DSM 3953]
MSNIYEIREMTADDIDGVLEVENISFKTPWSRDSFEKEMENSLAFYLVVSSDDGIAGYGGIWFIAGEGHITNIAVHPDFRNRGLGRAIVKGLIEESLKRKIEAMTLEVRISNETAIGLYKSLGFKSAGVRPGYYTDSNEDALIMWKEL